MKRKNQRWHKPRLVFFFGLSKLLVGIYAKLVYRYRGEKFDNRKGQYLFFYNHQTALDQNLMYLSLPKQPYTVATEDIFTMGVLSKIIRYTQAPIPFKKSASDFAAIKTCVKIIREGYSIALSPEGNRTFTGVTNHIKPSVGKLVKMLKLPVVIFIVRGGYGVLPRYADRPRRGRVSGRVERVITYEEYKDLSDEETYKLICDALYVDESDSGAVCKSRRQAEYLERALYLCPKCGKVGTLYSKGRTFSCTACGAKATLDDTRVFHGDFPFRTVLEWTQWQDKQVRSLPVGGDETPYYRETVRLRELVPGKKIVVRKSAEARLFSDRMEIGDLVFPFDEISAMTVCGKMRMDFYFGEHTYQLTADRRFCGLKYVNLYYHYRNKKEGAEDGFLGI